MHSFPSQEDLENPATKIDDDKYNVDTCQKIKLSKDKVTILTQEITTCTHLIWNFGINQVYKGQISTVRS